MFSSESRRQSKQIEKTWTLTSDDTEIKGLLRVNSATFAGPEIPTNKKIPC
jgi:hypothetical protein